MWTCTNPNCGKPLDLAKRGQQKYLKEAKMVVLECSHCGFEFMVKTEVETKSPGQKLTKSEFEIAAIRKRVKDFELK